MTSDLETNEFLTMTGTAMAPEAVPGGMPQAVFHEYGRLAIAEAGFGGPGELESPFAAPELEGAPSLTEELGRLAFDYRNMPAQRAAKLDRAYQGESWEGAGAGGPGPIHPPGDELVLDAGTEQAGGPEAGAEPPLSARLKGRVAVGLVIVEGPQQHLKFSAQDQTLVVSEVQNGLSYLASEAPNRDVTFVHEISVLSVNAAEVVNGTTYEQFEAPWRDAALKQLGMPKGLAGAERYARSLRQKLATDWAYVAFFTKYRLKHFAYANLRGPRLVMHFDNDGWGSNQIDRVFAHETGHIFQAPDEYAGANCNCGGSWGIFGAPNSNCALCAPNGGVKCIMKSNDWQMCDATRKHLGYSEAPGGAQSVLS
ncbi:hypothetical protein [Ruegeria sp. PrR005]|uniref:hypothetical protein n=1 Tax=Ruegeria sp. PrR005 TaxID=2706882 RepID=UPI001945748A|nr:hypothetical protein [Ruegeria sp. PrR005]